MRRKIKAFTLIELLVVISVIALLLAVLMPALGKTRDQTRRILCASNLKTIGMGDIMYAQESDNWHVPAYYWDTTVDHPLPLPYAPMWLHNPLFVTLVDLKGRHNAEDQDIIEAEDQDIFEAEAIRIPRLKDFNCPNDKRTVENGGLHVEHETVQGSSYAMNMEGLRPRSYWRSNVVYALKTTQVVNPAEKIFFMDGQWFVVYIGGAEYKRVWDVVGDKMTSMEWDAASYRHDEGANIAFYDGHVEYWKKERICPYLPNEDKQDRARAAIWEPIPGREYFVELY